MSSMRAFSRIELALVRKRMRKPLCPAAPSGSTTEIGVAFQIVVRVVSMGVHEVPFVDHST